MATYTMFAMKDRTLLGDDVAKFREYIGKHAGEIMRLEICPLLNKSAPKTAEELGYYWGCLVPEITKELRAQGITKSLPFGDRVIDIEVNDDDTHEYLTELCGRVGPNGQAKRLSDCDKHETARWLDNVLNVAAQLGMNMGALQAWRDKAKELCNV